MHIALLKSLVALVPALMLLFGSLLLHAKARTLPSFAQVAGAACLLLVVLTHLCEALSLLPAMRWGADDSIGHYLDISAAVLGVILFTAGYLAHAFARNRVAQPYGQPDAPARAFSLASIGAARRLPSTLSRT